MSCDKEEDGTQWLSCEAYYTYSLERIRGEFKPDGLLAYPYIRDTIPGFMLRKLFAELKDTVLLPMNLHAGADNVQMVNSTPVSLQPLQLTTKSERMILIEAYILQSTKYNILVDWFQEEVRVKATRNGGISPWKAYESLKNNNKWIAKNSHHILMRKFTPEDFRHELRAVYKKDCDLLSPTCVLWLLRRFNPASVLFWCVGWGGSIVASEAYGSLTNVTAVDCNKALIENLKRIPASLGTETKTVYDFKAAAFEDTDLGDNTYDLTFACPPYGTSELYSEDPEQSCNRYPKLDEWNAKFLKPCLQKAWKHLKSEGIMAVIYNDTWARVQGTCTYSPLRLAQYLHDAMDAFGDSEFVGTWGFKAEFEKTSFQPMFIWKKKKI
jgi:hypothetical protein